MLLGRDGTDRVNEGDEAGVQQCIGGLDAAGREIEASDRALVRRGRDQGPQGYDAEGAADWQQAFGRRLLVVGPDGDVIPGALQRGEDPRVVLVSVDDPLLDLPERFRRDNPGARIGAQRGERPALGPGAQDHEDASGRPAGLARGVAQVETAEGAEQAVPGGHGRLQGAVTIGADASPITGNGGEGRWCHAAILPSRGCCAHPGQGIVLSVDGVSVGDPAPAFQLRDQGGATFDLDDVAGPVLITFFPAAFTPVCTGEWQALAESGLADRVRIVGISCDPVASLRAYAVAEGIGFTLLSDFWPHGRVARAYGAFLDERGIATRASFLLDADKAVRAVWAHDPARARDVRDYLDAVDALER